MSEIGVDNWLDALLDPEQTRVDGAANTLRISIENIEGRKR
jgi:hypothetical protein